VMDNVCRDPAYSSSGEGVTHSAVSLPELPGGSSTVDHIMDDAFLPVARSGRSPTSPPQAASVFFGSSVDSPDEQRRLRISPLTSLDAENSIPRQPTTANNNISFVPHASTIHHFAVAKSPSVSSPSTNSSLTTPSANVQHVPSQGHERKHPSRRQQRKHNFHGYQMRQANKKRRQSQDKPSSGSGFPAVDLMLQDDNQASMYQPNYQSHSLARDYKSLQHPSYRRMM
jgi:hypothetical protein